MSTRGRWTAWAMLAVSSLSWSAVAQAAINISASLDPAGSTLPTRVFRDGNPSTCGTAKPFPGTFGAGPLAYNTHTDVVPSGGAAQQCVTVNVDVGTCDVNMFVTAYLGSFDPSNLATNYLADQGNSATGSFSFLAPAGSTIVLMVSNSSSSAACNYRITTSTPADRVAAVPALGAGSLALLGLMAAGLGAVSARRKRA